MADDAAASTSAADASGSDASEPDASGSDSADRPDHGTDEPADGTDEPDDRAVVVPDRVYKAVTVFSTLFAVVTVVGGFVVLDAATQRATVALSEVDPVLALLGVGLIVAGAVTYAFSTRFQADGMGNAKDDTDEPSSNG